jgi:hypothetical protein
MLISTLLESNILQQSTYQQREIYIAYLNSCFPLLLFPSMRFFEAKYYMHFTYISCHHGICTLILHVEAGCWYEGRPSTVEPQCYKNLKNS